MEKFPTINASGEQEKPGKMEVPADLREQARLHLEDIPELIQKGDYRHADIALGCARDEAKKYCKWLGLEGTDEKIHQVLSEKPEEIKTLEDTIFMGNLLMDLQIISLKENQEARKAEAAGLKAKFEEKKGSLDTSSEAVKNLAESFRKKIKKLQGNKAN